ncbi:MAG TPA: hypothetical protein VFS39_16180 [Nitrospira sp.]|nr:hypothetical protein [Nitrospira sp.]
MALLSVPPNGGIHNHTAGNANYFQWSNTNPFVSSGQNWRLKIGTAPFGYNVYPGTANGNPVPFSQLYDNTAKPNLNYSNQRLYATIEWQDNAGNWNNGGTYCMFTCKP